MKTLFVSVVLLCFCGLVFAQSSETVLYSFGANPDDGTFPMGGLLFDPAGNLYGITNGGGQYCENIGGCGTVYELSPAVGSGWTETILYSFCNTGNPFTCPDGSGPLAGLIMDVSGNLYGTTYFGGTSGYGTVFRLSPPSGGIGNWTETVLWNFAPNEKNNGSAPGFGKLNMDGAGNIYGTTSQGGLKNRGIVFELSPAGDGSYNASILHSFSGPDGALPQYGVAINKTGNLYGTTQLGGNPACTGGAGGCGLVYELTASNGKWAESVLYKFNGITGLYPISPISIDDGGNLYGTFEAGGKAGCFLGTCGGVFKLAPKAGGGGTKYTFLFSGQDGGAPTSGVLIGNNNLFGTTANGGPGVVFTLKGQNETVLYNFCSLPNCADGYGPLFGTLADRSGLLYGVTSEGGANGLGVVYSLTK
jgi:uncharacterized repeat protein (TIGR03803 family)